MELGLSKNQVRLVHHNQQWASVFASIKKELVTKAGIEPDRIQHIGSTAISSIDAKPVIDIVVGAEAINQELSTWDKKLKKADFYRLKVNRENEVVFAQFTDKTFQIKTSFIHLVNYEEKLWKQLIFFRDYLNEHEEFRLEYEKIKTKYAHLESTNIAAYTAAKEPFVQSVLDKMES